MSGFRELRVDQKDVQGVKAATGIKSVSRRGGPWKRPKDLPSQKDLLSAFEYTPTTGEVRSRIRSGGCIVEGSVVGNVRKSGYRYISFKNVRYPAYRLIWCMVYGYWPEHEVDHINRVKDDNRLCNLRVVSRYCQQRNKGVNKNSSTGVRGVSAHSCGVGFVAQITFNYKNIYIKYSNSFAEAVLYRWYAEVWYDYPDVVTNSSAYEYLIKHNIFTKEKAHEYYQTNRSSKIKLQCEASCTCP